MFKLKLNYYTPCYYPSNCTGGALFLPGPVDSASRFCCKGMVGNSVVAGGGMRTREVFFKIREIIACFYATDNDSIKRKLMQERGALLDQCP